MDIKKIILTFFIIFGINLPVCAEEFMSMYELPQMKSSEILFSQSKRQVNAINPTAYSNPAGRAFPGARGSNQLVIYTPSYGERTGTNEFGTEAIVEGNTVVELSGADSFIPENGAVISGHGSAKNWIGSNITIGTKIYYDELTGVITTYTTSNSYMFEAAQKIDEANSMIDYYKITNPGYDWKIPTGYIKEAQDYMRKGEKNPNMVRQYSQQAIESANQAIKSVLPFRTNEFKGVWIRPTETNTASIANSVRKIKNAGIDNIFLETYFHGKTIFPSETMENYGFIPQNEIFVGFDPLKVWINEAHKNGMKVHIWFETFYVGNMPPYSNSKSILAVRPEWGNKTLSGYTSESATPSASEHNGYFLDPSNEQVKEFLSKLLTEIIDTYHPDGINLDYIRYPQSISSSPAGNWGYTNYARRVFEQEFGVDPVTLTAKDSMWYSWSRFRREQVTEFVKRIGILTREKNVYLSAVIFPDKSVAYSRKLQDWSSWSQKHYINGFTPLFLTCDSKT
ncbi:MAG: family 10 glycosylhydrolase, partial [Alphaproteobacteria bacterium]|nr:family 10 glycosylhydrolase [Alphaproteobacteria bacterium]